MKRNNKNLIQWCIGCSFLLFLLITPIHVQADQPYVEGEILVKFIPGTSADDEMQIRRRLNAQSIKSFSINNVHYYRLPANASVEETIQELKQSGNVIYAEPNYYVQAFATPNDPYLNLEWGLHNTGQTGGTNDADIDAPEVWDIETGDPNLIIAVIDTGVDYTHPDLVDNMWVNEDEIPGNGIDDDDNGYIDDVYGYDFVNKDGDPFDDHGHGTHCSGTIAGVANNGIGVAGVAWRAKIMALKFLSSGGGGSTANAITAIEYARTNGAKILSNSWGGGGFSQALQDAIEAANNDGIIFVAAAGNNGKNTDTSPNYPSNYNVPNIISVAATDHNDALASFSNFGVETVDIAAPGVNIYSTVPDDNCSLCAPSGYRYLSGTSMATPHVSGTLALLWSHEPGLSHLEVIQRLLDSVDPIPALSGKIKTGGRLNINNALEEDNIPPAAILDLSMQQAGIFSLTLQWTASGDDGLSAKASGYDIRYATSLITEETWNTAIQATAEPKPSETGTLETFKISGLSTQTKYYIAIKARDNVGNSGNLSNVIMATTASGTIQYQENFENGAQGWTLDGDDGFGNGTLWHLSPHRYSNPNTAFYYGIENSYDYDTGEVNYGSIISPSINLKNSVSPILMFDHFLETEDWAPWDGATISISQNNGLVWTPLLTQYSTNGKWETIEIDLSEYEGKTIKLKFSFDTVDHTYNYFEGWTVDNIRIFAIGAADTTAPSAINNLSLTQKSAHEITFGWTCVGDDSNSGTATSYDMRYSLSPITSNNFNAAIQVEGEPAPQASGMQQSMVITGLNAATTYYFAMKVMDDVGLSSTISNIISTQTLSGPNIMVSPETIPILNIGKDTTLSQSLSLTNSGDMDLTVNMFTYLNDTSVNVSANPPVPSKDREEQVAFVPQQIIVKLKSTGTRQNILEMNASMGTQTIKMIPQANLYLIEIPNDANMDSIISAFSEDTNIVYAEPNFLLTTHAVIPNDDRFNALYGLHNTGQLFGTSKPDADIDAPEAWEIRTGSPNVIIAVIDTGVDYTHPDLASNIWSNPGEVCGNGIDDDDNGFIDDCRGWDFANSDNDPIDDNSHGTHVSGTIAAVGNNGFGVVGVTWSAQIMPLKFLGSSGSGSTFDAAQCVYYAVDNGATILNNSWGGGGYSTTLYNSIVYARNHNVLFVAASGNSGVNTDTSAHYPSSYDLDNILSVAATDYKDNLASYSNYGIDTVDLAAPGSSVFSTIPGNNYAYKSGTSMATPHVSGVAALVWAEHPELNYQDVINQILFNTDPLPVLEGKVATGGRLNLNKAMALLEKDPPAAVTDLSANAKTFSVGLEWTATGDDGLIGTASSYMIKYATSPIISDESFNSALTVPYTGTPLASGSKESMNITGLEPQTPYFFAIKVTDDCGNTSNISNVISATTKK
ncbi:MAG: S8 family serine peptidase, partial [Chlamydiota bacterium]|nr:S8 family serine peptidase [Chlamydiota bacterium]